MGDLADYHSVNPDPNNGACCVTNLAEPGVTFRGLEPSNWHYNQLFLGTTALHEAIAEFHGISVDEVKTRLSDDEKTSRGQIKKLKAENAKLAADLEVWLGFKARAEDAGLVVNL